MLSRGARYIFASSNCELSHVTILFMRYWKSTVIRYIYVLHAPTASGRGARHRHAALEPRHGATPQFPQVFGDTAALENYPRQVVAGIDTGVRVNRSTGRGWKVPVALPSPAVVRTPRWAESPRRTGVNRTTLDSARAPGAHPHCSPPRRNTARVRYEQSCIYHVSTRCLSTCRSLRWQACVIRCGGWVTREMATMTAFGPRARLSPAFFIAP
jgi:hypothetical protein